MLCPDDRHRYVAGCMLRGRHDALCTRRAFDYPRFAESPPERILERAREVCAAAGVEIEHVSKSYIRKVELVAQQTSYR